MQDRSGRMLEPAGPAEVDAIGVGTVRITGIDLPPQGRGVGEVVDLEPGPAGPRGCHNRHMVYTSMDHVQGRRPPRSAERSDELQRARRQQLDSTATLDPRVLPRRPVA